MGRRPIGQEVNCPNCNSLTRNKIYCSEQCQYTSYRKSEREKGNRIELQCVWCNSMFEIHKSDIKIHPNKKYCSRRCKDDHQSELYTGVGNPIYGKVPTAHELLIKRRRILLNTAKGRAMRRGLDFNLTLDDIIIPVECPLLNIPLFCGKGVTCSNSPSLDRIDPRKGYVKGNVHVISFKANSIKQDASVDELALLTQNLRHICQKSNFLE